MSLKYSSIHVYVISYSIVVVVVVVVVAAVVVAAVVVVVVVSLSLMLLSSSLYSITITGKVAAFVFYAKPESGDDAIEVF